MTEPTEALFKDATNEKLGLTHIDRYEIQEQIGLGAMGIVYRVHDPVFACDRALKILRQELVGEEDTIQRFREEGRAAVRASGEIAHPSIITVYDVGDFDGCPYIVMELFRGISLDTMLQSDSELGLRRILQIGEQLANALESAHIHGVVHRDVKPGNVLLSENAAVAKLTDFSVAQMRMDENTSSLTRTGIIIGAPRYMPPEQALGKEVDGRSDLYGLGIMLYEMVTGQKAYQSETFTALLIEISQSELKPINSLNKDVPAGVVAIINKLVEKDPARRFQSAGDLRVALKREIQTLAIEEMKTERKLPFELITAGLLALLVAGTLGTAGTILRNQQIEALENQTTAIGLEYADAFAKQVSFEYARNGEDNAGLLYQTQFSQPRNDSNIEYQHIVLTDGRVLASTDADLRGNQYEISQINRTLFVEEGKPAASALVTGLDGRSTLRVSHDIAIGPLRDRRTIGQVHVGFPTERIQAIGRLTLWVTLIATALVAFLVGLLTYSIIRYFMSPLRKMKDIMNVLSAGDHDVRAPNDKSGIIGEAYQALNGVAGALSNLSATSGLTRSEQWGLSSDELAAIQTKPTHSLEDISAAKDLTSPEAEEGTDFKIAIPQNLSSAVANLVVDDKTVMLAMHDPVYDEVNHVSEPIEAASEDAELKQSEPEISDSIPTKSPDDIQVDAATRVFRIEDI